MSGSTEAEAALHLDETLPARRGTGRDREWKVAYHSHSGQWSQDPWKINAHLKARLTSGLRYDFVLTRRSTRLWNQCKPCGIPTVNVLETHNLLKHDKVRYVAARPLEGLATTHDPVRHCDREIDEVCKRCVTDVDEMNTQARKSVILCP